MGTCHGFVAWHTLATIDYYYAKLAGSEKSQKMITDLLVSIDLPLVGKYDAERALSIHMDDFEDALIFVVAEKANADFLITRNTRDFSKSTITVMTPEEFLTSRA
jgi:predicted nucleic acid-binding protein